MDTGHTDRGSGQVHTGCRGCSWRISLWLGVGGESGLSACLIDGLDWHCHLSL